MSILYFVPCGLSLAVLQTVHMYITRVTAREPVDGSISAPVKSEEGGGRGWKGGGWERDVGKLGEIRVQ